MFRISISPLSIVFLAAGLLVSLGSGSCTKEEVEVYCRTYTAKAERRGCQFFCDRQNAFSKQNGRDRELLIGGCRVGQYIFLNDPEKNIVEAVRQCDKVYAEESKAMQDACRVGAGGENSRYIKASRDDSGSSGGDRETGNRGGKRQQL